MPAQTDMSRGAWVEQRLRSLTARWAASAGALRRDEEGGGLDSWREAAGETFDGCREEVDAVLLAALGMPAETGGFAAALAAFDDARDAMAEEGALLMLAGEVRAYLSSSGGETDHLAAARWHLERLAEERERTPARLRTRRL